jgi:uncharacterized protein with HEPN domain
MQLESLKYLFDIEQASRLLVQFQTGKTLPDYQADALLRSGVERQFILIGEALRRLVNTEPDVAAAITAHRQIIDFRNILVHGYDVISDERVWDILQNHLPILLAEVETLRRKGDFEQEGQTS